MDNEQSLNSRNAEKTGGISLVDILYVLRAHIVLIVIITLLFAAGGFLYAKNKKPVYTASVPVQFNVQINAVDEYGNPIVDQVSSTNYLFAYLDTAVDVCKSGDVLDRANIYYHFYLESGKTIDEFITEINAAYTKTVKEEREEIPGYEVSEDLMETYRDKWIKSGKVGTTYSSSKNSADTVIYFRLWVKDANPTYAKEMARIYALAADVSLNRVLNFGKTTAGLFDLAGQSSGVSVSTNAATKKTVVIAFVLGLVVSLAVVYIIYLIDNTVKSKEQLETLSGANVIAYIEDIAEVK